MQQSKQLQKYSCKTKRKKSIDSFRHVFYIILYFISKNHIQKLIL
jgi:hypothetical protein